MSDEKKLDVDTVDDGSRKMMVAIMELVSKIRDLMINGGSHTLVVDNIILQAIQQSLCGHMLYMVSCALNKKYDDSSLEPISNDIQKTICDVLAELYKKYVNDGTIIVYEKGGGKP